MDIDPFNNPLMQLLMREEPLDAALQPHLYMREGLGMQCLSHPLVMSVPHSDGMNAFVNAQYKQKLALVDKAVEEREWGRYIALHERPYRIEALQQVLYDYNQEEPMNWEHVGWVWQDSENINQCYADWYDIWQMSTPGREHCMSEDEQKHLAKFASEFTVYRGMGHEDAVEGMSWTTSLQTAKFFANRFSGFEGREPYIATGRISRQDILAYFNGRNESEIVVLPEDVKIKSIKKL